MQRVDHPDPAAANAQALDDLENGATGLRAGLRRLGERQRLRPRSDTRRRSRGRLKASNSTCIAIDLNLSPSSRHIVRDLAALVKARGLSPAALDLRFSINPIGGFAAAGKSPRRWNEMAPAFAAMVGELAGDGFRGPFAVADGRIIHNAGGSDGAGTRLRAGKRRRLSARARGGRHGARSGARRDLFPAVGRCRSVSDHGEIPRGAETVGPRRSRLRAHAEARHGHRRDRVAHDDQARRIREHAAHDDRGRGRGLRRRRCHHGAAAYRAARPARRFRTPRRAQHAACFVGRIEPGPRRRSGRRAPARSKP